MILQQLTPAQTSPEVPVNENFGVLEAFVVFGRNPLTTPIGLTWGYYAGRWGGADIAAGTVALTNAAANYIVVARATGVISVSTATMNWANTATYARIYKVTTAAGVVSAVEDHRVGPGGIFGA